MITCFYEAFSPDCLMAAAIVQMHHRMEPLAFYPVHGYESGATPNVDGHTVYILGRTHPVKTLKELAKQADQSYWVDHGMQREDGSHRAICEVTWTLLRHPEPEPLVVMWFQDAMQGNQLLQTKDFHRGLFLEPKSMGVYSELLNNNAQARTVAAAGDVINRYLALTAEPNDT